MARTPRILDPGAGAQSGRGLSQRLPDRGEDNVVHGGGLGEAGKSIRDFHSGLFPEKEEGVRRGKNGKTRAMFERPKGSGIW